MTDYWTCLNCNLKNNNWKTRCDKCGVKRGTFPKPSNTAGPSGPSITDKFKTKTIKSISKTGAINSVARMYTVKCEKCGKDNLVFIEKW